VNGRALGRGWKGTYKSWIMNYVNGGIMSVGRGDAERTYNLSDYTRKSEYV
jgi:hypothetical protein